MVGRQHSNPTIHAMFLLCFCYANAIFCYELLCLCYESAINVMKNIAPCVAGLISDPVFSLTKNPSCFPEKVAMNALFCYV